MEHIAALLLIIGCSDDMSQCRELPAPVPVFETTQECDAELPASYSRFEGKVPKLFAKCVFVDPAMEEADAELVWDIENGELVASVEPFDPSEVLVASNDRDEEGVATRR